MGLMAHLGRAAVFAALLAQVAVASSRSTHGGIAPSNASTSEREDVASAGELRGSRAAETGGARRALALTGAAVSAAVEPHKVSELRARLSHLLDGKVEAPPEETEEAEETETPLEDVTDLHTKLNHEDNLDQHKLALDPKKKVQINPDTGEPVSERNAALSGDQYYFYTAISAIFLASGIFMWCVFLPSLYFSEQAAFEELSKAGIGDRTFNDFLVYRFNNWMNAEGLAANTKILLGGTLSLVTAGSLLYICVTGRRIQEGLWLTFLWASASSVDAGSPRASGTVGVAVTVGGVILLAILLGTVTEFFAEKVQASKEGRDAVVEGGHILVLGHSANTKSLLEELALADPEKQMTVVLLDRKPKQEVEKCIQDQNTRLGNLKLVVRSGHASAWQDLKKVAADMASRIVIPEDPTATREESDANNFGTLLTLRGQQWPKNGYVTVQCCATRNDSIMREMGPSPTLVLNGERLGRLMVQSARDHGLCQVFSQIIGFEGDEFYAKSAKELGVVGWTFEMLAFYFPTAIPMGVQDEHGICHINPNRPRKIKDTDSIIMLAEDDDTFGKAKQEPFWDFEAWTKSRSQASFKEADPNDNERATVLLCNFFDRGVGCALLFALDEMLAAGSEVDIFTGLEQEDCKHILENAQLRAGKTLTNIAITIHYAPPRSMASMHYIERLRVRSYDHIFVLADRETESYEKADTKTVAMIIQLRHLMDNAHGDSKVVSTFNPVVETCTSIAEEQLAMCGITNVVNTSLLLSRALALVTMKQVSHGVLMDLLSIDGNNLDIQDLQAYLGKGEKLPAELSFAEATSYVHRAAQQILIGWTQEREDGSTEYIINPKKKLETRPWHAGCRLLVIKDV
jgi:hypothetical protein